MRLLKQRRGGWNQVKERKVVAEEMPSSYRGGIERTWEEIKKEREVKRLYDIVVRSRKYTLKEEITKAPLDPYPVKLFRALPRRASLPFSGQDTVLR